MPEILDWAGYYMRPSCMRLRLYPDDDGQLCAKLEGWQPAGSDPASGGSGEAEIKHFPVRRTDRETALGWAMANADEHGYPVVLLQDEMPPR
ncbi:MAG: hypothetical protein RLO51_10835 [Thalassobaculum sp.]|uniref:hypothetical protein n=1 Tax=Thalassobaculum sp. TaxID=2022740 RepID=UPI0032ED08EA